MSQLYRDGHTPLYYAWTDPKYLERTTFTGCGHTLLYTKSVVDHRHCFTQRIHRSAFIEMVTPLNVMFN